METDSKLHSYMEILYFANPEQKHISWDWSFLHWYMDLISLLSVLIVVVNFFLALVALLTVQPSSFQKQLLWSFLSKIVFFKLKSMYISVYKDN